MKSIALTLLVASISAVKLNDAPVFFPGPTWNETFPSAAGLVQTTTTSSCQQAGVSGVTCGPSDAELIGFAIGVSGTEDLNESITMNNGSSLVQLNADPAPALNTSAPEKVVDTLNPAFCLSHTTFYAQKK